jgi:hypothetical protein
MRFTHGHTFALFELVPRTSIMPDLKRPRPMLWRSHRHIVSSSVTRREEKDYLANHRDRISVSPFGLGRSRRSKDVF